MAHTITTMSTQAKLTRSETIAIVDAVRAGIKATAHHKNYTARVHDAVRTELAKINGNAASWVVSDHTVVGEGLTVWGPKGYDTRITFYGRSARYGVPIGATEKTWAEALLEGTKRDDVRDYVERETAEQGPEVQAALSEYDRQAANLLRQLVELRERADAVVAALPVPDAAVKANFRHEPHFWTSPSARLVAQFPNVFATK